MMTHDTRRVDPNRILPTPRPTSPPPTSPPPTTEAIVIPDEGNVKTEPKEEDEKTEDERVVIYRRGMRCG